MINGNNLYRVTFQVSRTFKCATIQDANFLARLTQQTMSDPVLNRGAFDLDVKITNIVPIGAVEDARC